MSTNLTLQLPDRSAPTPPSNSNSNNPSSPTTPGVGRSFVATSTSTTATPVVTSTNKHDFLNHLLEDEAKQVAEEGGTANDETKEDDATAAAVPHANDGTLFGEYSYVWFVIYALPTIALLIVMLERGNAATFGVCNDRLGGTCASAAFGGGSENQLYGVKEEIGCGSNQQSCQLPINDANAIYDLVYPYCWNNEEANDRFSTNSTPLFASKVWVSPSLYDVATVNLTKAVACCRFVPGGAAPPSISQLWVKAVVGVFLDVLLNLLSQMPFVGKVLGYLVRPLSKLKKKLSCCKKHDTSKDGAGGGGGGKEDEELKRVKSSSSGAMDEDSKTESNTGQATVEEEEDDEEQLVDDKKAMEDLHLTQFPDTLFFPSSLMCVKTFIVVMFSLVVSIVDVGKMSDSYSGWHKFVAWGCMIVAGNAVSSWIDIATQFQIWYIAKTKIFSKRGFRKSAWVALLSMTEYVVSFVAPSFNDPRTYQFFTTVPILTWTIRLCWIIYLPGAYLILISVGFIVYAPFSIGFFFTGVLGTGWVMSAIVSPLFDVEGNKWSERAAQAEALKKQGKPVPGELTSGLFRAQLRTFVGRLFVCTLYNVIAQFVYTQNAFWQALFYFNNGQNGREYLETVFTELSLRSFSCQMIRMRNAIETGDKVTIADIILSMI